MLHLMCCHCRYSAMYYLPHVLLQGWYHVVHVLFQVWYHLIPNVLSLQMWYQVFISGVVPSDTQCVVIADVVSGNTHFILSLQVILIPCCHYRCCIRLYSFYVVITGVVPGYTHFILSLQVWYQVILILCCHYRCCTR